MSSAVYCHYHPDAYLIEDHSAGDVICTECGLVVGDRVIDVSKEWRTFSNDDNCNRNDPCRVGASEDPLFENQLYTIVVNDPKTKHSLPKQRKSKSPLQDAFRDIKDMADKLDALDSITRQAKRLFKDVREDKTLKVQNSKVAAAACLYMAFRREGAERSLKEIDAVSKVSVKLIGRFFKEIRERFPNFMTKEKRPEDMKEASGVTPRSAECMPRFCGRLGLPYAVQVAAIHVAGTAASKIDSVAGKRPTSIAAAAIYLVSQVCRLSEGLKKAWKVSEVKKSESEVAEVTGVAVSTIHNVYKLMRGRASKLLPAGFEYDVNQLP